MLGVLVGREPLDAIDRQARAVERHADLRRAVIYGSVLASFCVEAFSLERLRKLTHDEIVERYNVFRLMSQFDIAA